MYARIMSPGKDVTRDHSVTMYAILVRFWAQDLSFLRKSGLKS